MSPRKASLRVAHQRTCANATKTSIDSLKSCTCSPSLYIFSRDRDGKPKKSARVKDRQTANRALAAAQREIDEGRVGIAREKNISFDDWATEYEKILDTRIRDSEFHPRTKGSYASTLQREARGVRRSPPAGDREPRAPSLHRAARQPAAGVEAPLSARVERLSQGRDRRPLPRSQSGALVYEGAQAQGAEARQAPFEDAELERLWAELARVEPVYLFAARFSAETGARLGELIALDWPNVDLLGGRVRIEAQYNARDGLLEPKDREPRTIFLTPHGKKVLDEWVRVVGARDEGPVFPNPDGGGLARHAGTTTAVRGRDDGRRHLEAAPGTPSAALVPLVAVHDERTDAAARLPSEVDRGDARSRIARAHLRRVLRLDARDARGGGCRTPRGVGATIARAGRVGLLVWFGSRAGLARPVVLKGSSSALRYWKRPSGPVGGPVFGPPPARRLHRRRLQRS